MITIINAQIPGYQELQQMKLTARRVIEEIKPMSEGVETEPTTAIVDLEGDWLSLGGIDLQINGCLGLAFPDLRIKDVGILAQIADYLWAQGVDGFMPTIVTTSVDKFRRSLLVLEDFIEIQQEERKHTAKVLGVHLEGPFLNYEKRGAHPAKYLLTPSLEALEGLIGEYEEIIKIVTLAPELDVTGTVIEHLCSKDIIVSLGHSEASAKEARDAFAKGASMVTHAFNAMPPLHHRKPGLLGEAITNKNVYCGLIADGRHVSPIMMEVLLRASDYDQGVFLVSDALAPLGLADGVYPWDRRKIEVINGTARLASGKLAGTTLPLLEGVKNLVKWGLADVSSAIALATEAPRKAMRMMGLGPGQEANLLRWHWDSYNKALTWERIDLDWVGSQWVRYGAAS
jgi:N-acetylglucosamine-6-phosphate deacetylase